MFCSCKILENIASGAIKFASENSKIASDNQIGPSLCGPLELILNSSPGKSKVACMDGATAHLISYIILVMYN